MGNTDPDCTVLLLSLQVASVGLNLTTANHIFFIDQPLSLTQQKQAVGRCHRIGQGKPVSVWSVVAADTIEACIASAATKELQEMCDDNAVPEEASDGNAVPRRARGRYLLGRQELMEYFGLTQEDIFDASAGASSAASASSGAAAGSPQ